MSLKVRLRIAVALLTSAMVVVLSALYMRGYLNAAFTRAHQTSNSLANALQAAVSEELNKKTSEANPPPATPEEAREFWMHTIETDPVIDAYLQRAIRHWNLVQELFITDDSGRIRASSMPGRLGARGDRAPSLEDWERRSLWTNLRQVYVDRQDSELRRPIAIRGETTPVLNVHVIVNSAFLRDTIQPGLRDVVFICLACLLGSLVLALALPNFVLSPLERLSRSIDMLTTGAPGPPPREHESKEFAAVYSKLNILGQRFQGAQESVDRLRDNVEHLLERLEEAVLLFDGSGRLTIAAKAVRALLGSDAAELTGRTLEEVFPPSTEIGLVVGQAVRDGKAVSERRVSIVGPQNHAALLVSVQPLTRANTGESIGTLVTLRDAHTRGELAKQLDLATRLTALGQLTRGVAHEIKNPLNAIILHLEMLKARMDDDSPELTVIANEISRLDRVVNTFLRFNRPVQPRLEPVDLNDVVHQFAVLLGPEAESRQIGFEVHACPEPAVISADLDLLKQSVLNILMNAVEAMRAGGRLIVETRRGSGRCEIEISDTGPGIPPEIQDKIFNLYFSTKEHGSGMGLAMTFKFVQLLDGKIEFNTQLGRGTTFRLSFPEATSPTRADLALSRGNRA